MSKKPNRVAQYKIANEKFLEQRHNLGIYSDFREAFPPEIVEQVAVVPLPSSDKGRKQQTFPPSL